VLIVIVKPSVKYDCNQLNMLINLSNKGYMKMNLPLACLSFCLSASLCSLETLGAKPNAPVTNRLAVTAEVSGRGL